MTEKSDAPTHSCPFICIFNLYKLDRSIGGECVYKALGLRPGAAKHLKPGAMYNGEF